MSNGYSHHQAADLLSYFYTCAFILKDLHHSSTNRGSLGSKLSRGLSLLVAKGEIHKQQVDCASCVNEIDPDGRLVKGFKQLQSLASSTIKNLRLWHESILTGRAASRSALSMLKSIDEAIDHVRSLYGCFYALAVLIVEHDLDVRGVIGLPINPQVGPEPLS